MVVTDVPPSLPNTETSVRASRSTATHTAVTVTEESELSDVDSVSSGETFQM